MRAEIPKRYFMQNTRTGKTEFTIANPRAHPGYARMERKYNKDGCVLDEYPIIVIDGTEYIGTPLKATQHDSHVCNEQCKRAMYPVCKCACGGKNHGIYHTPKTQEAQDARSETE